MPVVHSAPPDPGSYGFVFQRLKKDPTLRWVMTFRTEQVASRDITHRGRRLPTYFLRNKFSAERLRKMGYVDITEEWHEDHPEAHPDFCDPHNGKPKKEMTGLPTETTPEPPAEPEPEEPKREIGVITEPAPKRKKKSGKTKRS